MCGVAATLFLLGDTSAYATTYTYVGNELTWTTSCSGPTTCLPPLPGGLTVSLRFDFDTSSYTGSLSALNFNDTLSDDWDHFSYFAGPFSGPPGGLESYPIGSVTLTDGQITSWDLSTPGNRAGPSQYGEATATSGDSAFFAIFGSGSGTASAAPGTWSGPIADAFTTPLPAALPLFATGIAGLGLLGWRRKCKARGSLLGAA